MEEEPGSHGDDLHPHPTFVRRGLAWMRTVGVRDIPKSLEEPATIPFGQRAGADDMSDGWASLASLAAPAVASLVFGEPDHERLKHGSELAVGCLILMLVEVVHGLPVMDDSIVVAPEAQVAFKALISVAKGTGPLSVGRRR